MQMSHEEYKNASKRQKKWLDEMKMPTIEEMIADMPTDEEFRTKILAGKLLTTEELLSDVPNDAEFREMLRRDAYTIESILKKAIDAP